MTKKRGTPTGGAPLTGHSSSVLPVVQVVIRTDMIISKHSA